MVNVVIVPDADDTDGNWKDQSGGTSLYAVIDEASLDDADYIVSGVAPSGDICKIRLSDPASTMGNPLTISVRYKKTGTATVNLKASLLEGTTVRGTQTWSNIGTAFTTGTFTVDPATISDFTNLYVELNANPVTYTGPGDIVASATAWYGLRAYSAASIGTNAVRLRESGGNTEQDFATIAGGGLDLTAIATFKGANSLFVTKLYDQTGNGNDVAQATAANQPTFTLNGIGSLPVMTFVAASSTNLANATALLPGVLSVPWTISVAYKYTGTADSGLLIDVGLGHGVYDHISGAVIEVWAGGGDVSTAITENAWHAFQGVSNGATSDHNIDGTANSVSLAASGSFGTGGIRFGRGSTVYHEGSIVEAGVWGVAFSGTNSTSMSSNQHTYWGF